MFDWSSLVKATCMSADRLLMFRIFNSEHIAIMKALTALGTERSFRFTFMGVLASQREALPEFRFSQGFHMAFT